MATQSFNPIKIIITLVIDYFRWTQLVPMITVWGFGLLMLVALFFVNYQEESFDAIAAVFQWIAGLPWIGEKLTAWMESMADEEGRISLDGLELKAVALRVWGYLSLAMMLIALLVNWIFGPFKPRTLKRKLGAAVLCCLVLLAGYVAMYFAQPEDHQDRLVNWALSFGGVAILLFIVSAWCLSIAHLLGLLRQAVDESSLGSREEPKPPYTVEN